MITNFGSLGVAGLSLSKAIDMSDGLMDLLVIHKVDFKAVVEAATGALMNGEVGQPLTQWQVREITVVADPSQTMTRDGEVHEADEVHAEVVPHAIRLLWGSDHRLLLPASMLAGAAFLLAADTVARTVAAPAELPIGVVTACIGAPVLIAVVRSHRLPRL